MTIPASDLLNSKLSCVYQSLNCKGIELLWLKSFPCLLLTTRSETCSSKKRWNTTGEIKTKLCTQNLCCFLPCTTLFIHLTCYPPNMEVLQTLLPPQWVWHGIAAATSTTPHTWRGSAADTATSTTAHTWRGSAADTVTSTTVTYVEVLQTQLLPP